MEKKFIGVIFLLLCSIGIIISTPAKANHQKIPPMVCAERTVVLEKFKKDFNEIPIEQGVEQEGVLFIVLANQARNWTVFVSKINSPYTYCSLMSGTNWYQNPVSSTGVLPDGSVIAIGISKEGNWSLVLLNIRTGIPKEVTTGTGWERLVKLKNIQSNSL
tara:strand:+ start:91 stop:573 length:483 start_codon:yes stop_codon:yes gene_type:complete